VQELIEIAGGELLFPELSTQQSATGRIVSIEEVAARDPEVIIASWCGRLVRKQWIRERAGWEKTSAVKNAQIYEVKSTYILQPGPAALTEGVRQLHAILAHVTGTPLAAQLAPREKLDRGLEILFKTERNHVA
jgi:iron complex transport system substrate-binding protein